MRVFEIDFTPSADGVLCAIHGWKLIGEVQTAKAFLSGKTEGLFTRLTIDDVLKQMEINRDMVLVLDLKSYRWEEKDLIRYYNQLYQSAMNHGGESTLNRIIPQIYTYDEYDHIKEIYSWKSIILTLYAMSGSDPDTILSFVKDKDDIQIVASSRRYITEDLVTSLHSTGKKYYTYTMNRLEDMVPYKSLGIDCFYTDFITPESYHAYFQE